MIRLHLVEDKASLRRRMSSFLVVNPSTPLRRFLDAGCVSHGVPMIRTIPSISVLANRTCLFSPLDLISCNNSTYTVRMISLCALTLLFRREIGLAGDGEFVHKSPRAPLVSMVSDVLIVVRGTCFALLSLGLFSLCFFSEIPQCHNDAILWGDFVKT